MGSAPQGSAQRDFEVIRGKPGNAEAHPMSPGDFKRALTLIDGKVTSDADAKVKASNRRDFRSVDVNDCEHCRIDEAVISVG